ncbi:MAG: ATPase, T2SS/T4P/T4SS family [Paludibaculum sp.]
MIPTMDQKPAQPISWEQRLLKNAGKPKSSLKPEYQELKFTLHRKLLDKINLEALATIDNQRVRRRSPPGADYADRRRADSAERRWKSSRSAKKSWTKSSVSDRSRPLLQDPTISDILVNGSKQVYVERKGMLELTTSPSATTQHLLRIIDKIVSQVGRRVDESTPMVDARLLDGSPRQRDHSAAGARRPAAVHPPFLAGQADAGRSGGEEGADRAA